MSGEIAKILFGEHNIAAVEARLKREVEEHEALHDRVVTLHGELERKTEVVNRLLQEAKSYGITLSPMSYSSRVVSKAMVEPELGGEG